MSGVKTAGITPTFGYETEDIEATSTDVSARRETPALDPFPASRSLTRQPQSGSNKAVVSRTAGAPW
jgi:hypothetical protein